MICGSCHVQNTENRIVVENGWIKAGQQFAELQHTRHNTASAHYGYLTCSTCHDQHKSAVYVQGGIESQPSCSTCHPNYDISGKEYLDCIACHMPYSNKSVKVFNPDKADQRSHLFKIWVTTASRDSMYYTDATGSYLKLDDSGNAYGNTLDFVCLGCHQSWTIADVFQYAENIHQEGLVENPPEQPQIPDEYTLYQNYPNPFNRGTMIEFDLPRDEFITLAVYNLQGEEVHVLLEGKFPAEFYQVYFDSKNLASGVYFFRLEAGSVTKVRKMVLIR